MQQYVVLRTRRRLVGQPLIYAMTLFISLGVFLVRAVSFNVGSVRTTDPVAQFGYDQGFAFTPVIP